MKTWTKLVFLLTLLVALAWPTTALASDFYDDQVVFGNSYTLESGETLDGNLIVFGGTAAIEVESTVRGDVVVFGGTVDSNGTITGSLVGLGGSISLGESAVVEGDVVSMGAFVSQESGAVIEGDDFDITRGTFPLVLPTPINTLPQGVNLPTFAPSFHPVVQVLWFIVKLFLWSALAVIVVLFLPDRAEKTARTVADQPLPAGGLGCLSAIILPILLLIMVILICLIPVAILVAIAAALAWAFGLITIGLEVGKRMTQAFDWDWAPAASAGVGTFLLILVINGVGAIVPCVGWLVPAIVGAIGFGAVLLTRFGTQTYPQEVPYSTVVVEEELPPPSPPEELPEISEEEPPAELPADDSTLSEE